MKEIENIMPEYYTVKVTNNKEFLFVLDYLYNGNENIYKDGYNTWCENGIYYIGNNSEGWFYNYKNNYPQNPEITFEQFKKYVLNK